MNPFSAAELERMRDTQESAMQDRCQVLARVDGLVNDLGYPIVAYTTGKETPCGFNATANREVMDGTQVVITDARLRLPIDTVLDGRALIRITKRFGETLAPQPVYSIIGEPARGPSGLMLNLRLVTHSVGAS